MHNSGKISDRTLFLEFTPFGDSLNPGGTETFGPGQGKAVVLDRLPRGDLRRIFALLCLICLSGLSSLSSQEGEASQRDPSTVSILVFENLTEDPEIGWMSRSLADGLTASLKEGPLVLVERENLEDVIKEQKLSLSGLTDEDTALEVGRILNASQLVRGGYVVQQDQLRITMKITDTTTGEILYSTSVESRADRYFDLERELAGKVAGYYGFTLSGQEGHDTGSLAALTRYYDGLTFLDAEAYEDAAEAFRQSLRQDPSFLKPRESLADSYRFLRDFRKARYQREVNLLYKKLETLIEKAEAETFVNYGDWVVRVMGEGMTAQEISDYTQEHPVITLGNTRVETWWHAQTVMVDIASYAVDYFEDEAEAKRMYEMMVSVSRRVQEESPDDPLLDEVVYEELLAWRFMGEWEQVYNTCELMMLKWPDSRMMWAVEDFYEESLEALDSTP